MTRHESCPGEILRTWSSADPRNLGQVLASDPAVFASKRPVAEYGVKTYDDVRAVIDQPATITTGLWIFETGIQSRCPTRTRYDRVARFVVEIVP